MVLRRVRSLLTIGLLWGIGWAAGALGASSLFQLTSPNSWLAFATGTVVRWGLIGTLAGVTFAAFLGANTRATTLQALSTARGALFGGLSGTTLACGLFAAELFRREVPATTILESFATAAVLGATSGALTLALARRGRPHRTPDPTTTVDAPSR